LLVAILTSYKSKSQDLKINIVIGFSDLIFLL
jgi:hypothetical protein